MALLHLEGFENAEIPATYMARKYPGSITSLLGWVDGRFNNKCWRSYSLSYMQLNVDNKQTVILGFAWYMDSKSFTAERTLCEFRDSTSIQLVFKLDTKSHIKVYRGGTLIKIVKIQILSKTWQYIEIKIKIDSTIGSFEIRKDGEVAANETSINTQETGNAYINNVRIFAMSSPYSYVDDIYILDDTGSQNNNFLGDIRIISVKPNSVGNSNNFIIYPNIGESHYEDVDDGTLPDDDTTYIESIITGHKDLFNYENISNTGVIFGIEIYSDVKESDTTDYILKTLLRYSSSEDADAGQALTSSYAIYKRILDQHPLTLSAWTDSTFNITEFGAKVG